MSALSPSTVDLFCDSTTIVVGVFRRELKQGKHDKAFQKYKSHLQIVSRRYNSTNRIGIEQIRTRFCHEVAAVSTLISVINQWLQDRGLPHLASMAVNGIREYFPVFDLPENARRLCVQMASQINSVEELSSLLQSASNNVLEQSHVGTLSEYYTPPLLAEQLAKYAVTSQSKNSEKLKIVDPACGNGSLLTPLLTIYIQRLLRTGESNSKIVDTLQKNICGFDVQPYSVILTRLNLLIHSVDLFDKRVCSVLTSKSTLFSNIVLRDPLLLSQRLWGTNDKFDIVIANPPFARVINEEKLFLDDYADVIYGHANLYQLFLWWAIKATKPNGNIAFLIPQSFRSGQYFEKLREKINETCAVKAITQISHRATAFKGIQQPLVCILLKKLSGKNKPNQNVCLQTFKNSTQLNKPEINGDFKVAQSQVVRSLGHTSVWVLSDKKSDYEILDKVLCYSGSTFKDVNSIEVRNGGFVWNQQKEILREGGIQSTKPLISADALSPFQIQFPVAKNSISFERQFVISKKDLSAPLYNQHTLLIQRTTAKKTGRRIIGALTNGSTLFNNGYYVENHVNVIQSTNMNQTANDLLFLWGLTGWVNSRLLNFVFDMINGSAHISTYELDLLPLPSELIPALVSLTQRIAHLSNGRFVASTEKLDDLIFDFFHLTKSQRERLKVKIV